MKTTIYKVIGGGQQVKHSLQYHETLEIIEVSDSLYPEKSLVEGQNFFTGTMWAEDLKTLKRWIKEWSGGRRVKTTMHYTNHD